MVSPIDPAMGAPMHPTGRIFLDLLRVEPFAPLSSLMFARAVTDQAGERCVRIICVRGLLPEVWAAVVCRSGLWPVEGVYCCDELGPPAADRAFAFVAGARALTVKLVTAFDRVHVEHTGTVAPGRVTRVVGGSRAVPRGSRGGTSDGVTADLRGPVR